MPVYLVGENRVFSQVKGIPWCPYLCMKPLTLGYFLSQISSFIIVYHNCIGSAYHTSVINMIIATEGVTKINSVLTMMTKHLTTVFD